MYTEDMEPVRSGGKSSETSFGSPKVIAVPPTPSSSVGRRTVAKPSAPARIAWETPMTTIPIAMAFREPMRSMKSPETSETGM